MADNTTYQTEQGGVQQEDNYRELLTWITDGGLRYAFANFHNLPEKKAYYKSIVLTEMARDIVIVGAGTAGLSAGFELAQVGHKVTILEARDRAGGRIKTLREGFADGINCEGGPMRIPQQHFLVRHYVDLFDLQTQTSVSTVSDPYRYMHGEKFRQSDWISKNKEYCDKLWPGWDSHLPKGHCVQGIGDLYKRTIAPVIADLDPSPSTTEKQWRSWIEKWSQFTMLDFLRSNVYQDNDAENIRPWPEAAIEAFKEADYVPTIDRDVVWFLRRRIGKWADYPLYSIDGGSDKLPQAFLAKNTHGWNQDVELSNNVVYSTVVENIGLVDVPSTGPIFSTTEAKLEAVQKSRLRISCKNSVTGIKSAYEADVVILTAPLPTIQQIDIPWPEDKKRILNDIKTWSATKLFLQCQTKFWEKDVGVGGASVTDMQLGELYYHKPSQEDKSDSQRGVLLAYNWGKDADAFGSLTEEEALKQAVEQISAIHPEISDEFETGKMQAWGQEKFTKSGTASLGTQDYLQRLANLTTPTPGLPIYLASDSLSWANGWLQGAMFSGLMQAYCIQCNVENGSMVTPLSLLI